MGLADLQRVISYTFISEQYKYRHTHLFSSLNNHLLAVMPLFAAGHIADGLRISMDILHIFAFIFLLHHGRSSFPHYAVPSRRPLDSDNDDDDDDDEHLPVSRGIRSAVLAAAAHSRRKQRGTTLP